MTCLWCLAAVLDHGIEAVEPVRSEVPAAHGSRVGGEELDEGARVPLEDVGLHLVQQLLGRLVQVAHHVLKQLDQPSDLKHLVDCQTPVT